MSMDTKYKSSKIRDRAEKALRKYRAISLLINSLTINEFDEIERNIGLIPRMPRRDVKKITIKVEKQVRQMSEMVGCNQKDSNLEYIAQLAIEGARQMTEPSYVFVSKFKLDSIFCNYESIFPNYTLLPPHARIGLDFLGIRTDKNTIETFILEATLFEDMASLWNETYDCHAKINATNEINPIGMKRYLALLRSTAKAAFNLLEGYLNGLAFDILLTQEVSEKSETRLTEWDKKRNKKRFLTLRDKIILYPKIAVNSEHPVIDENSFPELKLLLLCEKTLRNSLIHPNPYFSKEYFEGPIDWKNPKILRETPFFKLNIGRTGEICDLVIDTIFKIDETINSKYQDVKYWLSKRPKDGKFPTEVFS